MSVKTIAPKSLAGSNQCSLAIYAWLGPNKFIFSSGRHFYLSPLAVQKVTTPLLVCVFLYCAFYSQCVPFPFFITSAVLVMGPV